MNAHTLIFLLPYSTRPVQNGPGSATRILDFETGQALFLNDTSGVNVQEKDKELKQFANGQDLNTSINEMCVSVEDYLALVAPDDTPEEMFEEHSQEPEHIITDSAFVYTRDAVLWLASEAFDYGTKVETYEWFEPLGDLRVTDTVAQQIQKGFELVNQEQPENILPLFDDVCIGHYAFLSEGSHHENMAQAKRIQDDFARLNQFLATKGAKPLVPVLL